MSERNVSREQAHRVATLAVEGDATSPQTWVARMLTLGAIVRRVSRVADTVNDTEKFAVMAERAADRLMAEDTYGLTRERMGQLLEMAVRYSLVYGQALEAMLEEEGLSMPPEAPPMGPRPKWSMPA